MTTQPKDIGLRIKPMVAVFIVSLVAFTILPIFTSSPLRTEAVTDCDPDGIAYSGASWLGGLGVNICNYPGDDSANYVNNINGTLTLSGYKWECVEMVNRLYLNMGWITANWYGNGNTLINYVPSGPTAQSNGSISYINAGDVITLDNGSTGHAAIINSTSGSTLNIINQNATLNSTATLALGSLSGGNASYNSGWYGYTVQAIVHHPVSSSTSNPIASFIDSSGVNHVFTGNSAGDVYDTYWGGDVPQKSTWKINTSNLGAAVYSLSAQNVSGVDHVYAATTAGSITDIFWGSGVIQGQHQAFWNGTSGDVISSLVDPGGYQHIFTGDSSGNIHDTYWTGTSGYTSWVADKYNLGAAVVSISSQNIGGVNHIYSATSAGSIADSFWGGGVSQDQHQAFWNGTSGDVISSFVDPSGYQHIFTGDSSGNVHDTYWAGTSGYTSWVVNTSNLGAAVYSMSSLNDSGVNHVYTSTAAGSITDIFWGGGVTQGQHQAWWNGTSGDVLSSFKDGSGYQHVFTGDSSGNVYDTYWTGTSGYTTWEIK